MADSTELNNLDKAVSAEPQVTQSSTDAPAGPVQRPDGWIYKPIRLFGKETWYASPKFQLVMVAFVCFLCPGMFNALQGIGGAGQQTTEVQDNANTALYSTFAVIGFFAGTFANRLGLRVTLSLGGVGYCIYTASFLCYNHTQNNGFVIFAGALVGLCAGLLWCGQGAIMMSYPDESMKGRFISIFWIIFNLGAVIGSLIPLAQNVENKGGNVTDGTYIAFIILMALGAVVALFMCNADKVMRPDGSHVILMKNPSWQSELWGLWETLRTEPYILLLFPMFFASNIFYTYQTNDMNMEFNTRTRSLNGLLYWLAQIFGAGIFGFCLDIAKVRRTTRARGAFVALVVLTFAIWGPGYKFQKDQYTRAYLTAHKDTVVKIDWTDGTKYIGPMFLYMFYGFYDSVWQTCIYWYMGALSNSGRKAANFAGFYKGIQSAGAAIFWSIDAHNAPYMTIFAATWAVLGASLVFAAPLIFLRIKDTVAMEQDLKFSDETVQEVAAASVVEKAGEKLEV